MRININKLAVTVLFGIMLITTTLNGCGKNTASVSESSNSECEESVDQITKEFPAGTQMELNYAKNFKIEYLENGNKLVTDGAGKQILLLQKGESAPDEYSSIPSITIPINNVIYTSSTSVGYLRAFSDDAVFDSIIGVRAQQSDWDFDAMKSRMQNGKIVDIGSNTTTSVSYDYEVIQSLEPSLVFTTAGMSTEQNDLMNILDQAGIKYALDGSSSETDYRGTMEWMKFYGAFYNRELDAENYFSEAMAKIDKIIEVTSSISNDEKVKVGWGIVSNGKIYVENAGSKSAQMIRDCGGKYIFDDIGVGSDSVTSISSEEFYERMSTADMFINRSMPKYSSTDISSITSQLPELGNLSCFTTPGCVLQITDNFWNSYHNIDGKYMELAEFLYPDKFDNVTSDKFEHFIIMTVNGK